MRRLAAGGCRPAASSCTTPLASVRPDARVRCAARPLCAQGRSGRLRLGLIFDLHYVYTRSGMGRASMFSACTLSKLGPRFYRYRPASGHVETTLANLGPAPVDTSPNLSDLSTRMNWSVLDQLRPEWRQTTQNHARPGGPPRSRGPRFSASSHRKCHSHRPSSKPA